MVFGGLSVVVLLFSDVVGDWDVLEVVLVEIVDMLGDDGWYG